MQVKYQLLSCILAITISSFSAETDSCFNLMNYNPPAFSYHLLEFKPFLSINGNSSNHKQNDLFTDPFPVNTVEDYRNHRSASNFDIMAHHSYYGWRGKTEWQINSYTNIIGYLRITDPADYRFSTNSQEYSTNRYRNGEVRSNFSISAAHYFRWPFFVGAEISPDITSNLGYFNSINKRFNLKNEDAGFYYYDKVNRKNKNYSISFAGSFRLGAGHIDDVSFAVAALNIVDIVKNLEKTYRGCDMRKVQNLAAFIEKSRKRRALDSRIAFIQNIDTLCAFIKESGIADEISPRTVLELADQWNYVFYQKRNKGFSAVLYPSGKYSKQCYKDKVTSSRYEKLTTIPFKMNEDEKNDFNTSEIFKDEVFRWNKTQQIDYKINLQARYERPLSRYFQLSLLSEASALSTRYQNKESAHQNFKTFEDAYTLPGISVSQYAGLTYYPNTRTSIGVLESVHYDRKFDYFDIKKSGYSFSYIPPEDNFDDRILNFTLNGFLTYYFSPQLQAQLDLRVYRDDQYRDAYRGPPLFSEDHESSFSTALNYSIGAHLTWKVF